MKIILGSQSQGRKWVLEEAGMRFDLARADIDEKAIRHDDYEQLPLLIARAKADALVKRIKEPALLITADTVVIYRGELREKPVSAEQAREFLRSYAPNEPAWVNTGVVVTNLATGKRADGIGKAAVYFKSIPSGVIEQAITDGYVFGCAGSFAIETPLLKPFVTHFEGTYDAVLGLPLELTRQLLKVVA